MEPMKKIRIIVGMLTEYLFGIDPESGKILWKVRYADIEPPTDGRATAPMVNCVTPLYHDGYLFITSGYDHVGVMFKLTDQGNSIEQVWINRDLDNHHGQVVRIGNYIYGSNWIGNRNGNWCCIDWNTGKTMYETTWHNKGPISAADGMLFCYDEKGGNLGLVKAEPGGFKISGEIKIEQGSGPHWTQPVIKNGVLYIRHGDALMAFDVKQKAGAGK